MEEEHKKKTVSGFFPDSHLCWCLVLMHTRPNHTYLAFFSPSHTRSPRVVDYNPICNLGVAALPKLIIRGPDRQLSVYPRHQGEHGPGMIEETQKNLLEG